MGEGFLAGTGWDDPCYDDAHFFVDPVPQPGAHCRCGKTYYRRDGYAIMGDMGYDREALGLEQALRRSYPRVSWHVRKSEDVADTPQEFVKFDWRFEVHCSIPGLDWRARQFLSREVWHHSPGMAVHMLGVDFGTYLYKYFFGGGDDGERC